MSSELILKTIDEYLKGADHSGLRVGILTLGCVRNIVDSQSIMNKIRNTGLEISDIDDCDIAIINTCSFVDDAKKESVDAILDLIERKKEGKIQEVLVAGCLPQRYSDELKEEFKEIDALVGIQELSEEVDKDPIMLTPQHFAYVKICESCYNKCSFCIIPKIKGEFVSRTIESIVEEIALLNERGVKEVNIVGQDITAYGIDIYSEKKLSDLLKKVVGSSGSIDWIRLLYTYPAHVTDELIDVIAKEEKICKYIDIPLQHISDRILKSMRRGSTKEQTKELVKKLRDRIPGVSLRTTFIVGFPGETQEEFEELVEFVEEARFEKMGVFAYSKEEGTEAYDMPDQVSEEIKIQRLDRLMRLQQDISKNINSGYIGQDVNAIIDGQDFNEDEWPECLTGLKENVYLARTKSDAPDVDGMVYIKSKDELIIGDIVRAKIIDATEYDLIGEVK